MEKCKKRIGFLFLFIILLASIVVSKDLTKVYEKNVVISYPTEKVKLSDPGFNIILSPENITCNYRSCPFEMTIENKGIDKCYDLDTFDFFNDEYILPHQFFIKPEYEKEEKEFVDLEFGTYKANVTKIDNFGNPVLTKEWENWESNKQVCNKETYTFKGAFRAPENTTSKFNFTFNFMGKDYIVDPYFETGLSNFNDGSYNNTVLNASGYVNLIWQQSKGDYVSSIYNSNSTTTTWDNVTWIEPTYEIDVDTDPIANGLVGYWKLNEASGTTAFDSSGNGNDGTNNGATVNQEGKLNTAYNFDSTNDVINISDSNSLDVEEITISSWINKDDNDAGYIAAKLTNLGLEEAFRVYVDTDETIWWIPSPTTGSCSFRKGVPDGVIDKNVWQHITVTYSSDGTGKVFLNGEDLGAGKIGTCSGILKSTAGRLSIGARGNGASAYSAFFGGKIDETLIFNRTLNPSEIEQLYRRGSARLNLTARVSNSSDMSGSEYVDYGQGGFVTLNNMQGQYFQYKADFFTDNINVSPRLQEVNVSYTQGATQPYTTIKHIDQELISSTPIEINNNEYQLLSNITFNSSIKQNVTIKMSGNAKKYNSPLSNTLYLKLENDQVLFDQAIISLTGKQQKRVFTTPITYYEVDVGENNLLLYTKVENIGREIEINNLELHVDFSRSTADSEIKQQVINFNKEITSLTEVNVANVTFNRNYADSGFINDIHLTYNNINGGESTPYCLIKNNTLNITEKFYRTVGSGETGSSGGNLIVNNSLIPQNAVFQILCSSGDVGTTINVTGRLHQLELKDLAGNSIPYTTNMTKNKALSDTPTIINTVTGSSLESGEASLFFYINLQSTSGTQEGTDSPLIKVNSSNLPEVNCSLEYERSLNDNDDIATIKGYAHCSGFTIGVPSNLNLYVDLASGETANVLSSSLSGYEATEVSTTESNLPPIVSISYPIQDQTVSGFDIINFTSVDPNQQNVNCSIYLTNVTETLIESNVVSPYNINYDLYAPGHYNLKVKCSDPFLEVSQDNVSIVLTQSTGGGLTADESSCILTGTYVNGSLCAIGEANKGVKNVGTPLAIILFMGTLIGALFYVPYKLNKEKKLFENPITNFTITRGAWTLALGILLMTTAMLATLAENAGIALTGEIFLMFWIISKALWVTMIWLVIGTLFQTIELWKLQTKNKRMGKNE